MGLAPLQLRIVAAVDVMEEAEELRMPGRLQLVVATGGAGGHRDGDPRRVEVTYETLRA